MPKYKAYYAKIINPKSNFEIEYFHNGILVINNLGKIEYCGDKNLLNIDNSNIEFYDYSNDFIIPGMIDTHTHLAQYEAIGMGKGELLDWLENYIFPLECKYKDFEYAFINSKVFFSKLLLSGTTSAFVYTPIFYQATRAAFLAAEEVGIRAYIGNSISDISNNFGLFYDLNTNLSIVKQLINEFHQKSHKLNYVITPRYAGNCSKNLMKKLSEIARNDNLFIQTHLAENKNELELVLNINKENKNYTEVYLEAGIVTDKSIFAHCIYLSNEEIEILKKYNSIICHCPCSNRFLISGIMPLNKYLNENLKISLGTDIAGGYNYSLLNEAREAIENSKFYKLYIDNNADILDIKEAFLLTNYLAAQSLGLESQIGSLSLNKKADFIILNNENINNDKDLEEILSKIIYLSEFNNIKKVFVDGVCLINQ